MQQVFCIPFLAFLEFSIYSGQQIDTADWLSFFSVVTNQQVLLYKL